MTEKVVNTVINTPGHKYVAVSVEEDVLVDIIKRVRRNINNGYMLENLKLELTFSDPDYVKSVIAEDVLIEINDYYNIIEDMRKGSYNKS